MSDRVRWSVNLGGAFVECLAIEAALAIALASSRAWTPAGFIIEVLASAFILWVLALVPLIAYLVILEIGAPRARIKRPFAVVLAPTVSIAAVLVTQASKSFALSDSGLLTLLFVVVASAAYGAVVRMPSRQT